MVENVPEPMSASRFAELANVYGGRVDRWPEEDRAAAQAFATGAEAHAVLSSAGDLDALLDTYAVAPPAAALQGRILSATDLHGALRRRLLRWWEGLGLVGVGLAGILAGAMVMSIELSGAAESNAFYEQATTVFGDVGKTPDAMQEAQ